MQQVPNSESRKETATASNETRNVIRRRYFLSLGLLLVMAGFIALMFWPPAESTEPSESAKQGEAESQSSLILDPLDKSSSQKIDSEETIVGVTTTYRTAPEHLTVESLRKEAASLAEGLVRDYPNRPDPFAVKALISNRFGNTKEASKCWEQCLLLDPNFADAYQGKGAIALKKGDYEKAVFLFRRTLALQPSMPDVRPQLADALTNLARMKEAAAVLENDIRTNPYATGSLFRLGQVYLQMKQYDDARKKFEAAIQSDPNCTYAYYGLANAWARLGEKEKSADGQKQFRKMKQSDREAETKRTRTFDDLNTVKKSVAIISISVARVHAKYGNLSKVEELLKRAVDLDSKNTACRYELGSLFQHKHRNDESQQLFEQIVAIEPNKALSWLNLGIFHAQLGHFESSEKAFQKAIEVEPENTRGYLALAQLYLRTGKKIPETQKLATKAVELQAIAPNYFVLSMACQKNGDRPGALQAIEKAMALEPNNPMYKEQFQAIRKE